MASNQPLTFRIAGELTSQLETSLVPAPTTPNPAPHFSLLLVGLTRNGSPSVEFCALDIASFGPQGLSTALCELIHAVDETATDGNNDDLGIEFNSWCIHWTPNSGVVGISWTTDLLRGKFHETLEALDAEYNILRLAAGRGTSDVLMVDYNIISDE